MRALCFAAALATCLGACERGGGSTTGGRAGRDSSGITIVENSAPAWTPGHEWRLSAEPLLVIGTAEGEEAYELHRVTGAVNLRDDGILIANTGTAELRFFDPSGAYLRSSGRSGKGPGEFQTISAVFRITGDSLLVWDSGNRRLSVLDAEGTFRRSFPPGPFAELPVFVSVVQPLADGTLLLGAFALRSAQSWVPVGLSRDTVVLLRCDREGEPIDTVGRFAGTEWYATLEFPRMDLPYARDSFFAARGSGFYFADNATWEISYRDLAGRVQRIIRAAYPLVEVTPRDVEDQKRRWLAGIAAHSRPEVARMLEPVEGPPTMPAFSALRVDAIGNVWVQHHQRDEAGPVSWTVFDPAGMLLGDVTMPARFMVHGIGRDYVIGRWRDPADVEQVIVYGLVKP